MCIKNFFEFFDRMAGRQRILCGKVVLIVDDGAVERRVYGRALEKVGCRVVTAVDATTAFAAVKDQKFDLIILDYILPDRNGVEICRELKSDPTTKKTPILFLTGSMHPEGVITCYDAGADCYLTKPIGADALVQQVRMTLQP
jgi:CheY-like chemotaxis protein